MALPAAAPPLLLLLDRRRPEVQALAGPLRALLAEPEIRRLAALRREPDRQRFLLARGALRLILGHWLGADPAALVLTAGARGKPRLDAGDRSAVPRFNVSHSGDLVLLGFHGGREVGVDLERRRPVPMGEAIARRWLPDPAWRAIGELPPERRADAFLAAWCRLEAGLKARGVGLSGAGAAPAAAEPDCWPLLLPEGYLGAAALL